MKIDWFPIVASLLAGIICFIFFTMAVSGGIYLFIGGIICILIAVSMLLTSKVYDSDIIKGEDLK
jgi:hypothetical protein